MSNEQNFSEKVVLVTGSTGQIGQVICKAFATKGAIVWVTDIALEKCVVLASELERISNRKHFPVYMDVTSDSSVTEVLDQIREVYGRVDILINNAGIAVFSDQAVRTKEEFMKVVEVNLFGTFLCIQKVASLMKENNVEGAIINIGSIYGMVSGDPRLYTDCSRNTSEVYGATKAGVIHMTKYFSVHLANQKIRVNCISPGGVFNGQGKDFVSNYSYRVPLQRMANEDEIVGGILFLSDPQLSSYVTGQNIAIDGGWVSW